MRVETYPLGMLQANCYLVWNENHVLLVDPGGTSKKLVARLEEANAVVDGIVLTHGHYDHIAGVDFFAKQFGCNVYISSEDSKFLKDDKLNCSSSMGVPTVLMHEYEELNMHMELGPFIFNVVDAPGHTNGSVLLIFDTFILSGDVLFQQSVGRCDLPTGSNAKMSQTIQMIKTLNSDYIVYPGHGPATTIQEELLHNPFFK